MRGSGEWEGEEGEEGWRRGSTKVRHGFGEVGKVDVCGQVRVTGLRERVNNVVLPESLFQAKPTRNTLVSKVVSREWQAKRNGGRKRGRKRTLHDLPKAFSSP